MLIGVCIGLLAALLKQSIQALDALRWQQTKSYLKVYCRSLPALTRSYINVIIENILSTIVIDTILAAELFRRRARNLGQQQQQQQQQQRSSCCNDNNNKTIITRMEGKAQRVAARALSPTRDN